MTHTLQSLLDAKKSLSVPEALNVFHSIVRQVIALHETGRIHRCLIPGEILLDSQERTSLASREPLRRLEGSEELPPEVQHLGPLDVPGNIEAARAVFAAHGVVLDPRRIDVYQLGVLLCRMVSGQPVCAYLRSPRVKAAVPPELRMLLDAALGHDPAHRLSWIEPATWGLSAAETTMEQTVANGAAHLAPGTRLGRYRIERRLGGGGMGDVYLACDESLDRQVAVKVLPSTFADQAGMVERFRNEVHAAGRLRHPNIVPVYEVGQEGTLPFYVMPYIEGESLEQRLECEGTLDIAAGVAVLEQVLLALEEAHAAGFVHRDVKPGNILLERKTGQALLADFGLVKNLRTGRGLTMTGAVLGTLKYLAPEQARGKAVDGRADLYSLGLVSYRMLAGRHPFEAGTLQAMMLNHLAGQAAPLAEAAPHVPAELRRIVQKLMTREVEDRYPSATAALADLRHFLANPPKEQETVAMPSLPVLRHRSAWRARLMTALLTASLFALAVSLSSRPERTRAIRRETPSREEIRAVETAGKLREFVGHRGSVRAVVFSPSGERAYTASEDGTIRAWDVKTAQELFRMTGHRSGVLSLAMSTDGRHLISGSRDITVRIWNAQTGQEEKQLVPVIDPCWGVSFSRDGRIALVASENNGVRLYGVEQGTQNRHYPGHWVNAVAPGPTIRNFLTGGSAGKVLYWNTADARNPKVLAGHTSWIRAVALTSDGKYAATCSGNAPFDATTSLPGDDCTVRWWDVTAGKELACLKGHTNTVTGVAIVPGVGRLVSVSADRILRLWEVARGQEVKRWETTAGLVSVAVSPDGHHVLTGSIDGSVSLWRLPE